MYTESGWAQRELQLSGLQDERGRNAKCRKEGRKVE